MSTRENLSIALFLTGSLIAIIYWSIMYIIHKRNRKSEKQNSELEEFRHKLQELSDIDIKLRSLLRELSRIYDGVTTSNGRYIALRIDDILVYLNKNRSLYQYK